MTRPIVLDDVSLLPAQAVTVTVGYQNSKLVKRIDAYCADVAANSALDDIGLVLILASTKLTNVPVPDELIGDGIFVLDTNGSADDPPLPTDSPHGLLCYADLADSLIATPYIAPGP